MRHLHLLLLFISTNIYSQQANFEGTGTAPNFFGYDLNENYHELNTYLESGKIVFLEFMNIYCGVCQAYAPVVEEFYSDFGPSGTNQIELIAIEINSSSDDTECEQYMSQYDSNYPLINGQNSYYYGYEAYYTPTFYIIYPDGTYTNYCSNICLNSTSTSELVNDFENIINEYYSLNSPWGNDPDTDCNSTILIQPTTNITLNNEEIPLGSWIGVFFSNENNELIYGGGVQWNGEVTSIAAWGSEAGLDNGFDSGEEFIFGIYDSENNQTIFSNNSEYSFGENSYSCNGLSGLTSISFETDSENNDINPWGNDPDTDCNSTILIQPTTNITLNNEEIPLGSWIGVFFSNENNELIYGGGVQWNGEVTSIAAWGSEAGLDNGFDSGEEFIFGIYDSENNQTIFSNNSEYSFGENSYSCNGLSGLTSISFETDSENNCSDNNIQMSAFGGCSEAISLLGCNFNFSGTLIEDICPVSCNNCENSNEQQIEGCTEENALNYDPNANIDDGSCQFIGCTEEWADNYDPLATTDDGSCDRLGCMEEWADNYDPLATTDNGSCQYLGCTSVLAVNYDSQANVDDGSCDYGPWGPLEPTGTNHNIAIPTFATLTFDGEPINNGDWIGLFYSSDDTGELVNCGSVIWTGESAANMVAWGAEAGMDNGFQEGEEFIWMIWDAETQETLPAAAEYDESMPNTNLFVNNGLSALTSLQAVSDISQTINLTSGWSLWSTYVHPDEANMSIVVNPIISSLDIVKDWEGNVYWPLFGINTIGELTRGEGYQIKTTFAETLTITGDLTPSNFEINLPNGWFIMGFLHTDNKDAGEMMAPIYNDLIILKDYLGNVYWPMFGINTIGTMEPGKGYQIKTMNPFTYSYPQGSQARYGDVYIERPVHFNEPVNTGNNMIIGLPLNSWETTPSIGDEIAAYGEDGILIGSTTFQGDHIALTIWGDDLTTNKKEGISEGETISFKLWNSQTGFEQALEVRWSQGVGFYTTDGISVAGQIILGSELTTEKQLVKITDVLGREVNGDEKDVMLLYIYDDGSIERVYTKE